MSASDIVTTSFGSASGSPTNCDVAERRQRRLARFQPPWQKGIAGLTACAPELEDLAETFPALLFALVSGYATPAARARVSAMVAAGACLKDAADALELPWWLRRLPPDAFVAPLPKFPTDSDFALRIGNYLPRDACAARQWFKDVSIAQAAAGADYALWFARHIKPNVLAEDAALMMGAWAWFSQHPGHLGHTLVRKRWSGEVSPRRALDEFSYWRRRLRLVDALGLGIEDCWLAEGTAGGLSFVPLRTVADFLDEAHAMENCLDQFADHLLTGHSVVFSIRRGDKRVACVEIGMHDAECTMPSIVQLRAPKNRRASPGIWQATFAWLGSQRLAPRKVRGSRTNAVRRATARQELWRPFLEHLAGTPYEASLRRWLLLPARNRKPSGTSAAPESVRTTTRTRSSACVLPSLQPKHKADSANKP